MQDLFKQALYFNKKPFLVFFLIFILISSVITAKEYTQDYNNPISYSMGDLRWCRLTGCTIADLIVDSLTVYNLSVIGDVFNVTMNIVTWNITDNFNVGGNLIAKNGTFDNIIGNIIDLGNKIGNSSIIRNINITWIKDNQEYWNNSDINVLRINASETCINNSCIDDWSDVNVSAGGVTGLDTAYDGGENVIDVDTDDVVWNLTSTQDFIVQDNGADVFIVNDDRVGVGTDVPEVKLHVLAGGTPGTPSTTGTVDAIIQDSSNAVLSIIGDSFSQIYFGDNEDDTVGRIVYRHSSETMELLAGTLSELVIKHDIGVVIGTNKGISPNARLDIKPNAGEVALLVNDDGVDADVRIETDTEPNMLFIDGADNYMNIAGGYGSTGVTIYDNGNISMDGDLNVDGNITADTIFAKAINISNSSFSFTDNENSSISFSIQNQNDGSGATSLIRTLNDVGGIFGIGIASSSYLLGSMLKPNMTALFSRSRGEMDFINSFKQPFVWYNNPSDDDDLNNLVEIMRLDENGLNVSGNVTAENVFLPAYVSAHTNNTIPVAVAGTWYNVTFDHGEDEFKKRITHNPNDGTNMTFAIIDTGIYEITYTMSFEDSAIVPNSHIVTRVTKNDVELNGFTIETDLGIQNTEDSLHHSDLVELATGDKIVLSFTSDDTTVSLSSHMTYGIHKNTGHLTVKRIA